MSSDSATTAGPPGDAGADLAAAAVTAMSSTAAVRAAADAMELQAVATLTRVRRQQAVADARSAAREADLARGLVPGTTRPARVDGDLIDRLTSQEVSVALTLSPVLARERLELARELVEHRPATFDALRAGQIDLVRARRICDAVRSLATSDLDDCPLASAVEAEVLVPGSVASLADLRPARPAGELTPAQLTARLTRLVLRADPAGAADRTTLANTRRGCSLRALPDGMALLSITGRAELLGAAFLRLDSTARQLLAVDAPGRSAGEGAGGSPGGDGVDVTALPESIAATAATAATAGTGSTGSHGSPFAPGRDAARTLDQTRVDVFLATVLGDSDDLSRAHNVRIDLALVATAGTVLGGGDEPGELDGHGAVPAPLARALAADARWRRWATDPGTGHITATDHRPTDHRPTDPSPTEHRPTDGDSDPGGSGCCASGSRHRTYRPNAAVADLIRARDQTCRFPTCRRRAVACDLDHVTPFPAGITCHTTMATECRLHHLCKHRGGFGLTIAPDGTTTWTTPTGQQVTTHPPSWGRRRPDANHPEATGDLDRPDPPSTTDRRRRPTSSGDPPF